MTLLAVGGAGYIGARFTQLAQSTGHHTDVVGRRPTRGQTAWPQFLQRLDDDTPPATVIWLLAGDRHNETTHLRQLIDAASGSRLRLVYASSCAVYGKNNAPAAEHDPVNPQNPYARTKTACEQALQTAQFPVCILRLATVHGHNDAGETKQSVHRMLHAAASGRVVIYGADNWRPFVSRDAAATALLRAALDPDLTGTINVAEEHATFGAVGRYAAQLLGAAIEFSDQPEPRSYLVDTAKARRLQLYNSGHHASLWHSMQGYAAALQARRGAHA